MKYTLACFMAFLVAGGVWAQNKSEVAFNAKINNIVSKMTLKEKIDIHHGNALFSSAGVSNLGIPELTCDDGPRL